MLTENEIGTRVIAAAIEVHRALGNGLLESVYEAAMAIELQRAGLQAQREVPINVSYKGHPLEMGFRADLIVEDLVLVELKSVSAITAAHRKQIQSYLNLAGYRLGYLMNFGAAVMKNGIVRCVNGLPEYEEEARAETQRRREEQNRK